MAYRSAVEVTVSAAVTGDTMNDSEIYVEGNISTECLFLRQWQALVDCAL